MNMVALIGRIVRDPEFRSGEKTSVCKFTVAVDRKYSKDKEADFIPCTAFGKTAEFVSKYFSKGSRIGVTGRWQTGSYDNKEGQKIYTHDCIIESVDFADGKKSDTPKEAPADEGYMNVPDDIDDEIPFKKA